MNGPLVITGPDDAVLELASVSADVAVLQVREGQDGASVLLSAPAMGQLVDRLRELGGTSVALPAAEAPTTAAATREGLAVRQLAARRQVALWREIGRTDLPTPRSVEPTQGGVLVRLWCLHRPVLETVTDLQWWVDALADVQIEVLVLESRRARVLVFGLLLGELQVLVQVEVDVPEQTPPMARRVDWCGLRAALGLHVDAAAVTPARTTGMEVV